jgi:hypothetical protein
MIIDNLKIEDLLGYRKTSLGISVLSVLSSIKKKLHIGSLKTGIVAKINTRLYKIYLISEGIKSSISEDNCTAAKESYPHTTKALNEYRKLHSLLEKTDFFGDSRIRDLSESTLSNFYAVETRTRHLAFDHKSCNSDDESLNQFASSISLGSLQA